MSFGMTRIRTTEPPYENIAEVYPIYGRDLNGEIIDNLPLLLAAPDLLAALKNLENDDGLIPDHAWKLVCAAIAKAEGRAP